MSDATLITGASAGIGREVARVFAKRGHDLVLVARRKNRLQELAQELQEAHGTQCMVVALDLAAAGACRRLYDEVAAQGIEIDVLVNNAGLLTGGAFRRSEQQALDAMIELNIAVPTRLCRLYVEDMVARGAGRIVNIASIGAFQAVPSLAIYAATKAYLLSFTEALSVELTGKGVTATVVCPGFTDTDMMRDVEGSTNVPSILVMPGTATVVPCMHAV